MAWKQLAPTGPHLTYLLLSLFLLTYAIFSLFIRNRLHLSEPPLATLFGILFGPHAIGALQPERWGLDDRALQEATRVIVGIQCFAVGVELPKRYLRRHWRSVAVLLGPVMAFGWLVCAGFAYALFDIPFPTALVVAACLTPTDPVLAASVLTQSQFSQRVPARIRNLLAAESGCNDGVSFPFLYAGLAVLTRRTTAGAAKKWFLITILWQCVFGTLVGFVVGSAANFVLKLAHGRNMTGRGAFLVFYLLMALFCVGLASTLGVDDFLLAFAAGTAFADDGWFPTETKQTELPMVIDLLTNSTMFVFFGAIIPWKSFTSIAELGGGKTGAAALGRLFAFLALVLAFRRIPAILALRRLIPDVHTLSEALFCGHFGPMGVGALFLAIEARAQLETDTSEPLPFLPDNPGDGTGHGDDGVLDPRRYAAAKVIWPIICFVVLGSVTVHGLSTLAISIGSHYRKLEGERAPLIGGETEGFDGMVHDNVSGESADEED